MTMTDPIGAMLTTLRNGAAAGKTQVAVPASRLKKSILEVLKREGYIRGYEIRDVRPKIQEILVELKYYQGQPVIKEIRRESKPSRRVYCGASGMPRVQNGLGIGIVSTSLGIFSDAEARKAGLGGEWICTVF